MVRTMTVSVFGIVLVAGVHTATAEDPVYFANSTLKAKVEATLGILDPTPTDMLGLTSLTVSFGVIDDLTGIEHAGNLQTLIANDNRLTDLAPLSGLSNLRTVDLSDNYVLWDLAGLSGCTGLDSLDVHRNAISDLGPLSGLAALRTLVIRNNYICDISPLSGLTNLESLTAGNILDTRRQLNTITDISPLIGMTGLKAVMLEGLPLSGDAYWDVLQELYDRDPWIWLWYDPNTCPPTGVSASEGIYPDSVHVTWNEVRNGPLYTTHYRVYRATSAGAPKTPISEWQFSLSFNDATGLAGTAYTYWVRASFRDDDSSATGYSLPAIGWTGYVSPRKTLIVDDDAPNDPGPGESGVSDPCEDGTQGHPFDSIQEAIRVAGEGASILVQPGVYHENIDLLGKHILLTGADPNDPSGNAYPVIAGAGEGPVVSFVRGEDPNCQLTGFVVTQGQGPSGGAILCQASSPTISHCVIAGNRAADPNDFAVNCTESRAVFIHCTIADNTGGAQWGAMTLVNSPVTVTNSIVWGNTPTSIVVRGSGAPVMSYTDVAGGWPGQGNINSDPLFARQGNWVDLEDPQVVTGPDNPLALWVQGDYHLRSTAGRWNPDALSWIMDEITSGCIDAGDQSGSVGYEPAPNGGIANLGAYGSTTQASKSSITDPAYLEDQHF